MREISLTRRATEPISRSRSPVRPFEPRTTIAKRSGSAACEISLALGPTRMRQSYGMFSPSSISRAPARSCSERSRRYSSTTCLPTKRRALRSATSSCTLISVIEPGSRNCSSSDAAKRAARSALSEPSIATSSFTSGLRERGRSGQRLLRNHLLQLARLVHLGEDVGAADELASDVQLRDRRPVRVVLDALAHFVVVEHVDRDEALHAAGLQDLDGASGESALRELRRALHEQDDRVLGDGLLDERSGVHGTSVSGRFGAVQPPIL